MGPQQASENVEGILKRIGELDAALIVNRLRTRDRHTSPLEWRATIVVEHKGATIRADGVPGNSIENAVKAAWNIVRNGLGDFA